MSIQNIALLKLNMLLYILVFFETMIIEKLSIRSYYLYFIFSKQIDLYLKMTIMHLGYIITLYKGTIDI